MLRDGLVLLPEGMCQSILAEMGPMEVINLYIAYLCSKVNDIEQRLRPFFFCALSRCDAGQLALLKQQFSFTDDQSPQALAYHHLKHLACHDSDVIIRSCYQTIKSNTGSIVLDYATLSDQNVIQFIYSGNFKLSNIVIRFTDSLENSLNQFASLQKLYSSYQSVTLLREALVKAVLAYLEECVVNNQDIYQPYALAFEHACFAHQNPRSNHGLGLFSGPLLALTRSQSALKDGYLKIKPQDDYSPSSYSFS